MREVERGRIRMPRHGWIALGLAVLLGAAAVKLAVVDRSPRLATYPLAGAAAFGFVALLAWLVSGRIEVTREAVRVALRYGGEREVPLADVERVGLAGSERAGHRQLVLHLRGGEVVRIRRVAPLSLASVIAARAGGGAAHARELASRPLDSPRPTSFRWVAALAPWTARAALGALGGHANAWAAANLAMIAASWIALVAAHEAGHAIAARLVGFDVHGITLGSGPRLGSLRVLGVRVVVFALPFEGRTYIARARGGSPVGPRRPGDGRRRLSVVSAAGPIVEVCAAAASLAWCWSFGFGDVLVAPAPMAALAFASLSAIAATAVGHADDGVRTDVEQLMRYARMTDAEIEASFGREP